MSIKFRLTLLSFLQFAVWGAYLTSMGTFLAKNGLASQIGWFYSVQGLVSLCMPALMGILADRWIQAQRLLSVCHLMAGTFKLFVCFYALQAQDSLSFAPLFSLYACSVAFFMPTIALSNSVAYTALENAGLDTVKSFPSIRVWGTIGFIVSMWIVDLGGMQTSPYQFAWSAFLSFILALYARTLPSCPVKRDNGKKTLVQALGLNAFALFRNYRMAVFFVFSMLLGVCLQITNGFANPFISSFGQIEEYAGTFGVAHANILISMSQISETLCFLFIPFCLSRFGIKRVMLIAMLAWALRFLFFAVGNPGEGVWLFVLSMLVYGIAFDFFNISGSLFVDKETDSSVRSSAQGLFMMMTNGFGATFGMIIAQMVINKYVYNLPLDAAGSDVIQGWTTCWYLFALYALCIAVAFSFLFSYKHIPNKK